MERHAVRTLWVLAETLHAVIYFAPEKVDAYKGAGLKGGWMGYFASRAAALGPVGPEVVAATFYNFHPGMVARAIPDAWTFSTPERVLEARYRAAGDALHRLTPDYDETSVAVLVAEIRTALGSVAYAGRPLGAAYAALPWPEDPLLALWHGCTVWREYRGDAHVAALVSEGLGPIDAHLTLAGTGATTGEQLRANRGWSEEEWDEARRDLQARDLLDEDDRLTPKGMSTRDRVEALTDARSAPPWDALDPAMLQEVTSALRALVTMIVANGGIPLPNPMGLSESELDAALGSGGVR